MFPQKSLPIFPEEQRSSFGATPMVPMKGLVGILIDPAFYAAAKDGAKRGHAFYGKAHVLSMWDSFYTALATAPVLHPARHGKRVPA